MDRTYSTASDNYLGANLLGADFHQQLEQLRAENDELRALVLELEQALQHPVDGGQATEQAAREYEALLEEKSELIRQLHRRVQDLEDELAEKEEPVRKGPLPREDELMRLSEELERERRQLKEDEDALMEQMRQMELQMARERAEMARQRTELQRIQNDLHHELEVAARDNNLRERLAPLQRRHADASARRGARG